MAITDWTDAYAIGIHTPGSDAILETWGPRSEAFRAAYPAETLRYGAHPRQFVDLYRPARSPRGWAVLVHGGYWQMLSGRDFAFWAEGALAQGYGVALPTYRLASAARLPEITQDIAQAIAKVAQTVSGGLWLCGHSAGGHLVSRMGCVGVLPSAVAARIQHILSLSGVHDLRPLLKTEMNAVLGLDFHSALQESPALCTPRPDLRLSCVVGSEERPEFLRQSDLLANIWTGLGAETSAEVVEGRHHFDITDDVASADGAVLTRLFATN